MTWHPTALAIWLLDITAWLIYMGAAWRLLRILPNWRPLSLDARQLWCERALELTRYQGRWVLLLLAAAYVLLVIGISNLWPSLVPGAMCGTGVLQAMGAPGARTLLYRALTLGMLYVWLVVVQIDGRRPEGWLSLLQARLLLMASPFMALGSWSLAQALPALTTEVPVSCCAVLYDQVGGQGWVTAWTTDLLSSRAWFWSCMAASGAMTVWGALQWWRGCIGKGVIATSAGLLLLWLVAALNGLKFGIAPYVYEVLGHPCPWCFFLTAHHAVGFVFYGLVAVVMCEALAGLVAVSVGRHYAVLARDARRRSQCAGRRVMWSSLLFWASTAAPVVFWRVRFGGWID